MGKIIRLTETDLTRLIKRVINEGRPDNFIGKSFKAYSDKNQTKPTVDFEVTSQKIGGSDQVLSFGLKLLKSSSFQGPDKFLGSFSCQRPGIIDLYFAGDENLIDNKIILSLIFTGERYGSNKTVPHYGPVFNQSFWNAVSQQWCYKKSNGISVLKTADYVKSDNQDVSSDLV
jgi:hypothetical protein